MQTPFSPASPAQASADEQRRDILSACRSFFSASQNNAAFVPGETYIPTSTKVLDADDLVNLVDASLDMWLTAGRFARDFERLLPRQLGKHGQALLVNSGSSANLLAVSSLGAQMLGGLGIKPITRGDEVITVAAGFPTTVSPIIQNGWVPVFVDVDASTLNTTLDLIKAARTNKTRAVVLAHTLGNPYRADLVSKWCEQEGLYLVEDCCDALGARIGDRAAGSFGHFATLSFYPAHHITMGEGGAVVPRNAKWKRVAESLRDWGRDCWCEPGQDNTCGKRYEWQLGQLPCGYDHKYTYSNIGYNLKATDMQAALGLSQLNKLERFVAARCSNWKKLYEGVRSSPILSEHIEPVIATDGTTPSWFGFPLYCSQAIDREKLVAFLEQRRIGTRLVFGGDLTKQPAYQNVEFRVVGELKSTDRVMRKGLWIAVHPALDDTKIAYMLDQLEQGVRAQLQG